MGVRLKTTILDSGGGNRLNSVNYNEFKLYPDCFEDENTLQTLTSFENYDIYNAVGCVSRKSGSDLYITPQTSNNIFSFSLTNNGTTIEGFALAALPQNDISISLVRNTLGESSNQLSVLCTSSLINIFSPSKPNKSAPYRLGDFRGYCHNAAGGFNIYNPNAEDVNYLANYSLIAAITKNQEAFTQGKVEIFVDDVSQGSATKSLSNSIFVDKVINNLTNNNYWTTNSEIKVIAYKYNDSNQWEQVSVSTVTKKFRGKAVIGILNTLFINTNTARLDYNYHLYNQTGNAVTMTVKIKNVTKNSSYIQITHSLNADSDAIFQGTTNSLGVTNETGDEFDIIISNNAADYIAFETGDSLVLPYGI